MFDGSTNLENVYVPAGAAQNYRTVLPANVNVVEKAVVSIRMKTNPDNLSEASITVSYNDGTTAVIPVTPSMVSGYDAGKPGSQTVTVAYGGAQCTFGVNVTPKSIPNGASNPAKAVSRC